MRCEAAVLEERNLLRVELIGEGLSEGDVELAVCLLNEIMQRELGLSAAEARIKTLAEVYAMRREIAIEHLPGVLAKKYAVEEKDVRREISDCLDILRKDSEVPLAFVERTRVDALHRLAREAWKSRRAGKSVLAGALLRAGVVR